MNIVNVRAGAAFHVRKDVVLIAKVQKFGDSHGFTAQTLLPRLVH